MKPLFCALAASGMLLASQAAKPRPVGPCEPYAEVCRHCSDCTKCRHCAGLGGKCSVCFKR